MIILRKWTTDFIVFAVLTYCVSIVHIQSGSNTLKDIAAADSGVSPELTRPIPKDNIEAVHRVVEDLGPREISRFRELSMMPEEEMDQVLWFELSGYGHHGLGTSIRNSFGFWEDSRLSRWYAWRGYRHPDSKSRPILEGFKAFVLEAKEPSNLLIERLILLIVLSLALMAAFRFFLFLKRILIKKVSNSTL